LDQADILDDVTIMIAVSLMLAQHINSSGISQHVI